MGPKSVTSISIRERKQRHREDSVKMGEDTTGVMFPQAKNVRNHKKLEGSEKLLS